MKFGKRLAAEANRRAEWSESFVDYKRLKKATKLDIGEADLSGSLFNAALDEEMERVSRFFKQRELDLQAQLQRARNDRNQVQKFTADLHDTRKFVMLNYIAVVKALKKRNRLMEEAFGSRVEAVDPISVLSQQHFFTSTVLAQLSTQAEVLSRDALPDWKLQQLGILDEFTCPVCLGVLHDPVILSCAHRFCWGCVVAHCANQMITRQKAQATQGGEVQKEVNVGKNPESKGTTRVPESPNSHPHPSATPPAVSPRLGPAHGGQANTFDCPVCRKPQIVDDAGLQVDEELSRFVERLQNLRLTQTGQSVPGAGAADRSRDMLESMVSSHAALVDTLRDLVVPHPSHWLSEVQSTAQGEADPGESGEKPAGAAITMGIRPAPAEERGANGAADVQRPRRGTLGAPATVSDALRVQGLHGPEGGDKEKYGAQVDRLGAEQALLPEQRPEHRGKLTVVLDLDGTLVSTYTVKRAPAVPRGYLRAYVVGKGGPLNTDGVFVVERPGLREFLTSLSQVAEVVLFTAGLEDYAKPIVGALDPDGTLFTACLYRPATVESKYYQCVKDLSRLGRNLARTVLVDDTPLAFLNQPHNGIPVFSFKGDVDDRLLGEAILPLIWNLSRQQDVRHALRRRFQMGRWFLSNGFDLNSLGISLELPEPPAHAVSVSKPSALVEPSTMTRDAHGPADTESAATTATAAGTSKAGDDATAPAAHVDADADGAFDMDEDLEVEGGQSEPRLHRSKIQRLADARADRSGTGTSASHAAPPLLVCDFDQTLLDYDSLGRLIGLLAPDLLRMWMSVKQPQNFIPMTNSIFGAFQRRGISAHTIEHTLRKMGRIEFPRESAELIRDAASRGCKVFVLSDCNDWLIELILAAADVMPHVTQVITNTALFTHASHLDDTTPPTGGAPRDMADPALRLAVFPRHPWDKPPHGCPYCPANLCKGAELSALRAAFPGSPVVYCGDGANDYCPSLRLGDGDAVLARKGFALDRLIQQSLGDAVCKGTALGGLGPFHADMRSWSDHEDLRSQVGDLVDAWVAEGEKRKSRISAQSQNLTAGNQLPAHAPRGMSPVASRGDLQGMSVGSTPGFGTVDESVAPGRVAEAVVASAE